jgi:glycosyltransferase involved in cell wall biosynthesis
MPKILYVSTSTTVGGAEKTLYTLATLVNPSVAEVAGVVSLKPKGRYARELEGLGKRVYSLKIRDRAGLQDLQKLALVVHETKPDIVHAVMYQAIQLARGVKRLGYADFKLVSSPRVHYRTRTPFSLFIDGLLKKVDDLLISESEASRKYLVEKLGYDEKKTLTIRNGVDIAGWSVSQSDRKERREMIGISEKDVLIGCVGRLEEQKGHVYLIDAIAELLPNHPEVKCVILGEGPAHEELQQRINTRGIGASMGLLGEQSEITAWLSAFDVFVLPSLWEGIPNALLEAMALGLPVIASDVDGVPETVVHDLSGILVKPGDVKALVQSLQDMIEDASLRERLGREAKNVVNENFKLPGMIESYEKAYRAVLTGDLSKLKADPAPGF